MEGGKLGGDQRIICKHQLHINRSMRIFSWNLTIILAMQRLSKPFLELDPWLPNLVHRLKPWPCIKSNTFTKHWDLILIAFPIQSNQGWGTWYQVQSVFWNVFSLKKCLHFRKNTLYPLSPISPASCCAGEVKFYFFPILSKLHLPLECEIFTLSKVYKITYLIFVTNATNIFV